VLVWIFGVCVSCTPINRADAIFEDYLYRMSNVFQFDEIALPVVTIESFPSRRKLQYQPPQLSLNLLEFLRLSRCELQRLLGARNSSLGITMANSQHWLYELSFIELAQQCLQTLASSSKTEGLRQQLELALMQKRSSLEEIYWNATWGSEEFQYVFSAGITPMTQQQLELRPIVLEQALIELLAGANYWQSLSDDERRTRFESQLAVLASEKYLGQLRVSMNLARQYLLAIERAVTDMEDSSPLCGTARLSRRTEIMERVFMRYYIGAVQPMLSGLHQRIEQIREVFMAAPATEIVRAADADDRSFAQSGFVGTTQEHALIDYWQAVWADRAGSEWRLYQQAISSHTLMWQDVLRRCDRLPH
tara:strand:- start:8351 stop:9439 length:1089 start_codon:yes stop_codon:yes gene_type:complete